MKAFNYTKELFFLPPPAEGKKGFFVGESLPRKKEQRFIRHKFPGGWMGRWEFKGGGNSHVTAAAGR